MINKNQVILILSNGKISTGSIQSDIYIVTWFEFRCIFSETRKTGAKLAFIARKTLKF